MTALHWFHSHHHRLHFYTLRYLLPILLALILFFLLASPARGQVWIDESQLNGKLPSWVDPAYAKPPVAETVPWTVTERAWLPAVVQRITERVWLEDRYEYRTITRCVDGQFIFERVLVLVEPAHLQTRYREIVIVPGHWETVIRYE